MAGLLDFLNPQSQGLGAQPQQGLGFMGRASSFNDQNPGALIALGAGIMNRNPAQGFAAMAPVIAQGKQANATAKLLLKKGIAADEEEAMAMARSPELLSAFMKGDDIISVGNGRLYNKSTGEWITDPSMPPGGTVNYSVTPTLGTDPKTGKTVLGTVGDDGSFRVLDTPGFEPYSPYDKSFERSAGGAAGKVEGEAIGNLDSMNANMPGLEATVKQLTTLSDEATYTPAGQLVDAGRRWADMEPREGAVARTKYMAIVDNQVLPLLRETFGAQFTVTEGESLRATLGAPDKTPTEKKAVLDAFIQQKRRNIEALSAQTGRTIPAPAGGSGGWTVKKVTP